jgi:peroxiredoxin
MRPKLFFFLFLFPFFLNAQALDSTLIEANIEGMANGKIRIVGIFGEQNFLADSAVAVDGRFTIRRTSPLSPGFYTFLIPGNRSFSILVDQNDQRMQLQAKFSDLIGSMRVTGCTNTEQMYRNFRYQMTQDPELGRLGETLRKSTADSEDYKTAKKRQTEILEQRKMHLDSIYAEYPDAFFTVYKKSGQNPDFVEYFKPNGQIDTIRQLVKYRDKFWDNVDFSDERLLHTPVVANKLKRYIKELTPQQPDSLIKVADVLIRKAMPHKEYFKFFCNWIALQYENGKTSVMDGEAVYVHIIKNFFTPELAFWSNAEELKGLQKHVGEMEASLLGRKGPDVRANDINGIPRSIYEKTAPIIVVFMFSPTCEHCIEEAPDIQRIYEKYKTRGVDLYSIAVSTNEAEWKAFVKKNGFTFTNVYDPTNRAIYAKYFVDNTPEIYVLNKDRTIVAKNLKATQLDTVLERELKKVK